MCEPVLLLGEGLDLMSRLDPHSIDMILVDTPFGKTKDKRDKPLELNRMWEETKRVIKPHGAIVHFAVNPYTSALVASNKKGYKHRWVWNKRRPGNYAVAKYMPLTTDEDLLVFTAKGEKVNYYPIMRKGKMRYRGSKNSEKHGRGFGGMAQVYYQSDEYYPTSILDFPAVPRKQSLHPSQKPVPLLKYLIQTYTLEGQTVLDFCAGSGSTLIAAHECNRNGIAFELDPATYDLAKSRLISHLLENTNCQR